MRNLHLIDVLADNGDVITATYTCPTNGADGSPCNRGWTVGGGHRCALVWEIDQQDVALAAEAIYTTSNDMLLTAMYEAAGVGPYAPKVLPAGRYAVNVTGVDWDLRPVIDGPVGYQAA